MAHISSYTLVGLSTCEEFLYRGFGISQLMIAGLGEKDERWTFGTSLEVEDTSVGIFKCQTQYASITSKNGESNCNWILASIPTPNVTQGWNANTVMLRYRNSVEEPEPEIPRFLGIIDHMGVRDGDAVNDDFIGLNIGLLSLGPIVWWVVHLARNSILVWEF